MISLGYNAAVRGYFYVLKDMKYDEQEEHWNGLKIFHRCHTDNTFTNYMYEFSLSFDMKLLQL